MRAKCPRCNGSGDMGVMSACRCNRCGGTGVLLLDAQQTALWDWIEGYLDPGTSDDWLEDQLRRLMEVRSQMVGGKHPDDEEDVEDDDEDLDP